MQYHVVATQTLIDLEEMCNALICEGWEPQRGRKRRFYMDNKNN